MATELGSAYISIGLGTNKLSGDIKKAFSASGADGDAAGKAAGSGFASGFKGIAGPAIAAVGAIGFGGLIAEAARASDATDKFMSTMNFAGLDTSAIDAATKAAKGYADETVYELSDIQKTMATLAANGVEDYTGITKAAGNLNAVAGGNAETFKSVSLALGQSAGAGKLMAEDWNMLADAIPGASGQLQDAMREAGAFEGNFKEAMEAGEISADEFQAAISKLGSDPIAVEAARSVTTFEGALGNLSATVNSGLMAALDALKPAITGAINGVSSGIGRIFSVVGGIFTGLKSLIMDGDITPTLLNALGLEEDSPIIGGLVLIQTKFWEVYRGIQDFAAGFTIPMPDMAAQLGGGLEGAARIGAEARIKVESVLNGLRDFVTGFTIPMPALMAASFDMSPMANAGMMVRDALDQIGAVIGPLVPDMIALWQATSPLQIVFAAIQPLLPQLLSMFGQLATVIGGSLVSVLATIVPVFVQLSGVISQSLGAVLAAVLPAAVQMITMLGATLSQLLPIILPIIATVIQLATTLVSQLAPIITDLVSTILPPIVSIFGDILAAIGPLITTIAGLLIPVIQALMPVVVTVFSVVADVIKSAMQIVQGIIQVVTGIIKGDWEQVWTGIGNIFKGIWDTIVNLVRGALQIIGQVVMSGLGLVGGFVRSTLNDIGRFFADTWNNVVNGVSGMIGNVVGFFSGLIGKITGAIGNAGSALFSVGKNIVQGLIDGIGSMMGSIGRAVMNIVPEAIRGPFEQLLGIHSPSRVFRGYGLNIGQGLILGLNDMTGKIDNAVTGMVSVPPAPSFGAASYSAGLSPAVGGPAVYVQNPFTGEYLLAQVGSVAAGTVQAFDSNSQYRRAGRI